MKRLLKNVLFVFIIITAFFHLEAIFSLAQDRERQDKEIAVPNPRYELKLTLNEFSILNSSVVDGLNKYGGNTTFDLKIAKEGNELFWTVSTNNQRLIEVLRIWVAEKSIEFIKTIDADNLDNNGKIALKATKALTEKIDLTLKNPIWDLVTISGTIVQEKGDWYIIGKQGKYKVTSSIPSEQQNSTGKRIIVRGYVKLKDEIEAISFKEIRENTLELFVMSKCPFGRDAEISMINFLNNHSEKAKPAVEIRYIFYKQGEGEKATFTSLHGEEEIHENLVQIVIRDKYNHFFFDYLKQRVFSKAAWDRLASEIGMKKEDIKNIKQAIENEKNSLIQKEYDYATNSYQIYDGSPTYIWEGEKVSNIQDVEIFKGMNSATGDCSN